MGRRRGGAEFRAWLALAARRLSASRNGEATTRSADLLLALSKVDLIVAGLDLAGVPLVFDRWPLPTTGVAGASVVRSSVVSMRPAFAAPGEVAAEPWAP